MRQWLLGTHCVQQLNQGAGVLDVAGGRGELSFQLHLAGVRVTCIDRRACKPCKALSRLDTHPFHALLYPRLTPPNVRRHAQSHPDDAGPRMLMGEDFDLGIQKWADMCAPVVSPPRLPVWSLNRHVQGARVLAAAGPAP